MRRWLCSVAERIRVHVCKSVEAELTVWFTVYETPVSELRTMELAQWGGM